MNSRLLIVIGAVALTLEMTPVLAQEAGGVAPPPEALRTENVLGVLGHVAAQLQLQAMMRGNSGAARAAAPSLPSGGQSAGASNPGPSNQGQQTIGRLRGDGGFLAGFAFGQPLAASRTRLPQPVAVADPVVVNQFDGPVAIGNGNLISQQVSNSTAISTGPAIARSSIGGSGLPRASIGGSGLPQRGQSGQSALSQAYSLGGIARSTAINNQIGIQSNSQNID